jgi:hypothetical protein
MSAAVAGPTFRPVRTYTTLWDMTRHRRSLATLPAPERAAIERRAVIAWTRAQRSTPPMSSFQHTGQQNAHCEVHSLYLITEPPGKPGIDIRHVRLPGGSSVDEHGAHDLLVRDKRGTASPGCLAAAP